MSFLIWFLLFSRDGLRLHHGEPAPASHIFFRISEVVVER